MNEEGKTMKGELAETVADIVAELREDAEHVEDDIHNEDFWSNTEAGMIYRELAARIEAANDRQMAGKCGNAAAMREALKRIIAIEGYGAPWIEAKVIAQKALEGAQCTPPPAQDTAKIEHPCDAAAMREALEAIDRNTDLLDIAEGVAPNLCPSHSFVAVQIRKIVRDALATTSSQTTQEDNNG